MNLTASPEQSLAPRIVVATSSEAYGRFVVEPLAQGFGVTLGNALRRTMLNSLPGTAVTAVRIEGTQHEYSTLPHVQEDVIDFLLNVKGMRLRSLTGRPGALRLEVGGRAGPITAGDIEPSGEYQVVNPELVLLHVDSPEARFSVEFQVEQGTGYRTADSNGSQVIGLLPVDALFTPIRRANFEVEPTRVGQVVDYDRLILEVWTDRTTTPGEAVQRAAQILVDHLAPFVGMGRPALSGLAQGLLSAVPEPLAEMPVEELKLSSRTQNSLRRASLATVGQVLEKTPEELLGLRNFGDRSLEELYERLRATGVPVPEGDDRLWRKSPLAALFQEHPTPVAEAPEALAVYTAGGLEEEVEEEAVDISAFSRRSFSPDDEEAADQ